MTGPLGRRGLPPQDDDPEDILFDPGLEDEPPIRSRARRGIPEPLAPEPVVPVPASPGSPRRGIVEPEPEPDDARRAWLWIVVLGIAIAVAVAVMWLVFGTRDGGSTAVPRPVPAPATSAATQPTDATEPSEPATTPSQEMPTEAPLPSGPASPTEATSGPASPSTPVTPPSVEPSVPTSSVELDDGAAFRLRDGWELYADQQVQNDRRLVRLRDAATDVRIQAVSLTSVTGPLDEACLDLVAEHRSLYTGVAEGLPVGVSISGEGTGISCNFTGTRVSDGVPAMVEFTLLQRGEATLVFRDTIPTAVAVDSTAREQLVAMECEAATSFGVAVDQCALIPAPADG